MMDTPAQAPPPVTWRDYARLARLEMVGTPLIPLAGAIAMRGPELRGIQVAALYAIYIPMVSAAIIHNDLMDLRCDRLSPQVVARPLASGRIPARHAWLMIAGCLAVNALVIGLFYPWPLLIFLIAASWLCAGLYNALSKRVTGADLFYSASGALTGISGALIAQGTPPDARALPPLVWVVAAVAFMSHLFMNAISGGLKDLANDRRNGVRSLAARMSREGPRGLGVTPAFKAAAIALELAVIGTAWIPFVFFGMGRSWQTGLLAVTSLLILGAAIRMVSVPAVDRVRIMQSALAENIGSNFLLWILIAGMAGRFWMTFALIAPWAWALGFNFLINGRLLQPADTF